MGYSSDVQKKHKAIIINEYRKVRGKKKKGETPPY
jgi:hypothetical protein